MQSKSHQRTQEPWQETNERGDIDSEANLDKKERRQQRRKCRLQLQQQNVVKQQQKQKEKRQNEKKQKGQWWKQRPMWRQQQSRAPQLASSSDSDSDIDQNVQDENSAYAANAPNALASEGRPTKASSPLAEASPAATVHTSFKVFKPSPPTRQCISPPVQCTTLVAACEQVQGLHVQGAESAGIERADEAKEHLDDKVANDRQTPLLQHRGKRLMAAKKTVQEVLGREHRVSPPVDNTAEPNANEPNANDSEDDGMVMPAAPERPVSAETSQSATQISFAPVVTSAETSGANSGLTKASLRQWRPSPPTGPAPPALSPNRGFDPEDVEAVGTVFDGEVIEATDAAPAVEAVQEVEAAMETEVAVHEREVVIQSMTGAKVAADTEATSSVTDSTALEEGEVAGSMKALDQWLEGNEPAVRLEEAIDLLHSGADVDDALELLVGTDVVSTSDNKAEKTGEEEKTEDAKPVEASEEKPVEEKPRKLTLLERLGFQETEEQKRDRRAMAAEQRQDTSAADDNAVDDNVTDDNVADGVDPFRATGSLSGAGWCPAQAVAQDEEEEYKDDFEEDEEEQAEEPVPVKTHSEGCGIKAQPARPVQTQWQMAQCGMWWLREVVQLYMRHNEQGLCNKPTVNQLQQFVEVMLRRHSLLQLTGDPTGSDPARLAQDQAAYQVRALLFNFGHKVDDTVFNLFGVQTKRALARKKGLDSIQPLVTKGCWFTGNKNAVYAMGLLAREETPVTAVSVFSQLSRWKGLGAAAEALLKGAGYGTNDGTTTATAEVNNSNPYSTGGAEEAKRKKKSKKDKSKRRSRDGKKRRKKKKHREAQDELEDSLENSEEDAGGAVVIPEELSGGESDDGPKNQHLLASFEI
jgi:hypothetical protein